MLRLNLDESIDNATGMCFVAGYLGDRKQWKDYVTVWRKELGQRESIHITRLRLGTKQAPRRYGDLLRRLGSVPEQSGLRPFAGSICRKDYESRISGTVLEILMEGYVLAILGLMDELAKHIHPNERVEVFFEEQVVHAALRERAMVEWRKRHRTAAGWSVLARWGSIPKGTLTEASDYLCYALQQRSIDAASQKAKLTSPILNARRCEWNHQGKAIVDDWFNMLIARRKGRPIPKLTDTTKRIIRSR